MQWMPIITTRTVWKSNQMQWVCFDKTCASYVFLDNVQLEFSMIGHSKPTSDGELKLFAPRNDLEHASEYLTNNKQAYCRSLDRSLFLAIAELLFDPSIHFKSRKLVCWTRLNNNGRLFPYFTAQDLSAKRYYRRQNGHSYFRHFKALCVLCPMWECQNVHCK